jgi:hypothetical protein
MIDGDARSNVRTTYLLSYIDVGARRRRSKPWTIETSTSVIASSDMHLAVYCDRHRRRRACCVGRIARASRRAGWSAPSDISGTPTAVRCRSAESGHVTQSSALVTDTVRVSVSGLRWPILDIYADARWSFGFVRAFRQLFGNYGAVGYSTLYGSPVRTVLGSGLAHFLDFDRTESPREPKKSPFHSIHVMPCAL